MQFIVLWFFFKFAFLNQNRNKLSYALFCTSHTTALPQILQILWYPYPACNQTAYYLWYLLPNFVHKNSFYHLHSMFQFQQPDPSMKHKQLCLINWYQQTRIPIFRDASFFHKAIIYSVNQSMLVTPVACIISVKTPDKPRAFCFMLLHLFQSFSHFPDHNAIQSFFNLAMCIKINSH